MDERKINNKSPVILLNYARSGGTLLNRLLGSLPNVCVLSEVNILGCAFDAKEYEDLSTVKNQIKEFYDIDILSNDFIPAIEEVLQHCKTINNTLVIRDWTYFEFNYNSYYQTKPTNRFTTIDNLEHLNPICFAFVRDSIDVWISRGCPELDEFYPSYINYLKALKERDIKIFKYEDLTEQPALTLREICNYCGLKFVDVTREFSNFKNVNGDINPNYKSRGFKLNKIKPLSRKAIPLNNIYKLNKSSLMKEANELMDYPVRYHQSYTDHLKFKLSRKFNV